MALWTPDINLFRDPRWGRGQEVPGEDPTLNAHYAMNYVRGVQEDAAHPGRLKAVSTGKHFMDCECSWLSADRSRLNPWAVAARADDCENCRALGDSCMPNTDHSCGTDRTSFNANVSQQDQVEYYWPAWRAAAAGGKIESVMCSCAHPNLCLFSGNG